jgi:hypothetical protein
MIIMVAKTGRLIERSLRNMDQPSRPTT